MTPAEILDSFRERAQAKLTQEQRQLGITVHERLDTHAARGAARDLADMGVHAEAILAVAGDWHGFTAHVVSRNPSLAGTAPTKPDLAFVARWWRLAGEFLGRPDIATAGMAA